MLNLFNVFAIDFHMSLKAERLFSLGPLDVTNSMVFGFITAVSLLAILLLVARKSSIRPSRGIGGAVEVLVEFIIGVIEAPLGSRAAALKYAPYFGVFFFFVIFTNIVALIPLVGPNINAAVSGEQVPLFRPFTADLNGTIAMSIVAVGMVQYLSIKNQGLKNHLRHFFPGKVYNPIDIFMSLLEVLGEFTKILSLSMRLFLNTVVGEILIAVFTSIVLSNGRTPFVALPIIIFEIMIAAIQAYVYIILCASYLGISISGHDDAKDDHSLPVMSGKKVYQ